MGIAAGTAVQARKLFE
jgi:hypothetical protein